MIYKLKINKLIKVKVYKFKIFNINSGEYDYSDYYATATAVEQFNGLYDQESVIEVDEYMLDRHQRYKW